jgi:F0F1-type ATP synthase epsilon subunit
MSSAPEPVSQLQVRVLSPSNQYFDGPAQSVTAQNDVGQFDILADHANFFTLLSPGTLSVVTHTQRFELPIHQGLLKVAHNQVTAFVDIEGIAVKTAS